MEYNEATLLKAVVQVGDLGTTSKRIEKVLRAELNIKSRKETDLTKADFSFYLPQIRPMWTDAWKVERFTDVMYFNLYRHDCYRRVYQYCKSLGYRTPSLSLLFSGAMIQLRNDFTPEDRKTIYIDIYNRIPVSGHATSERSRSLIRGVAKALKIENRMTENDSGFIFDKHEGDNRKVISRDSSRIQVNPKSLTLELWEIPFRDIELLFENAIAFITQEFGELKSFRIDRQVLHHAAAEAAEEVAKIDDRWDMQFFSEYRKGFDPFTRPANVEYERMYPVVRHISEPTENDFFLDLQVTVYHGINESYLLLHTQRDQAFLQEIADEARVEISEFGIKDYHGLEDLTI